MLLLLSISIFYVLKHIVQGFKLQPLLILYKYNHELSRLECYSDDLLEDDFERGLIIS